MRFVPHFIVWLGCGSREVSKMVFGRVLKIKTNFPAISNNTKINITIHPNVNNKPQSQKQPPIT